jgi:protein-tyrosine phosphatase
MSTASPTRVCFVCLGNICRSPTAEGWMRHLVAQAGQQGAWDIDSAGTGGWHQGEPPDPRAVTAAAARGVVVEGRARRFEPADYDRFDLVLAMDRENRAHLLRLCRDAGDMAKVRLIRDFDPAAAPESDVPDPYYGGPDGFVEILDQIEAACRGLLSARG